MGADSLVIEHKSLSELYITPKPLTTFMDGKGRATDNSCIERFWRSAKCERIYLNEYQSISELITDVGDYIEFYNLIYITPKPLTTF
jgi:transposase InsO family protein